MNKNRLISTINSKITVKEVIEGLGAIKITFNNKVIYDDTETNPNYIALHLSEDFEGLVPHYDLYDLTEQYKDKIVYSYYVEIVSYHHSLVHIIGEQ